MKYHEWLRAIVLLQSLKAWQPAFDKAMDGIFLYIVVLFLWSASGLSWWIFVGAFVGVWLVKTCFMFAIEVLGMARADPDDVPSPTPPNVSTKQGVPPRKRSRNIRPIH